MRPRPIPTVVLSAVLLLCSVGLPVHAQDGGRQVKVGVLPFVDATGSGGSAVAAMNRLVQAEIVHSTELAGRVLSLDGGMRAEDVDIEKAVEIGRSAKVDLVVLGTVLDAKSEYSSKGGWGPRVMGQTVGGNVRSVKAQVLLQGDIVSVGAGKRVASVRTKGDHSDKSVGASVYTDFGSLNTDGHTWQDSPIGKALHEAITELVKRIQVEAKSVE